VVYLVFLPLSKYTTYKDFGSFKKGDYMIVDFLLILATACLIWICVPQRKTFDTEIKRKSDATIEVIAGKYTLKEK
jgi:hypothetical protein